MRYAYLVLFFVVIATVSLMGFRGSETTRPPLEVFPDMDRQPKYKPQAESRFSRTAERMPARPAGRSPLVASRLSPKRNFSPPTIIIIAGAPPTALSRGASRPTSS